MPRNDPPPPPAPPPAAKDEGEGFLARSLGGLRWPVILLALLLAGLIAAMLLFRDPGADGATEPADNAAEGNNALGPGPGAVLSDVTTIYTKADAMLRDAPTAEGSTVIERLPPGEEMMGVWVAGRRDATTRWLRVTRAGSNYAYIWEGNLTDQRPPQATDLASVIQIDPRDCAFGGVIADAFARAMHYDEDQELVTAGRPFRLPGLDQELVPERTEWSEGGRWRVEVPLAGRWRGLQVRGLFLDGAIESDGSRGILFAEPKSKVVATLNREGFRLDTDGYRELSSGAMSADSLDQGTQFGCGG